MDAINEFLLRTHAVGQNSVLIVDEAQNLGADVLEQLRLLTNLETNERKLLQIVLIGQPELRTMLERPHMEQLAQRVIARYHLDALSEGEAAQYIRHRLGVAGLKGAVPFERGAIRRIHQLTRGVPRCINLLCDRALLGAYAAPLTPFIGRERELADLGRLIAEPECRCITLVGPGGIGKTRLALQAADKHKHEFAQGSAFIPLASVASVDGVIPAIANAIHFAFYGPNDPKVQLLNYLRGKQMLLIVDNVEHLLVEGTLPGTIADLLIEILHGADQVKLLVTSREAMNLQGVWILEVKGLAYPGIERAEKLAEYSAVALFIQRARGVSPGFEMNAENKTGVLRLCRMVATRGPLWCLA